MEKVVPTTVLKSAEGNSFVVEDMPVQIQRLVEMYDEFRQKHVDARTKYESAVAAERYFELATTKAIKEHLESDSEEDNGEG